MNSLIFAAALSLLPGGVEVVVSESPAQTTQYAVREFTNFVSQALGAPVPVVTKPTAGKVPVRIGEGPWSRKLDLASLKRDGFYICADADGICLCGRDDASKGATDSLVTGNTRDAEKYEMGSLFAVYAFLEDYAGCRFYFPGEIGTIVPKRDRIEVPDGVRRVEPAYSVRRIYAPGDGDWYDGKVYKHTAYIPGKAVNWLRLRLQTQDTPCCHGLNFFMLPERFGKDHPEYFQLGPDGKRCTRHSSNIGDSLSRHLCNTSKVWDEIYRDVRSYFLGEGPEVRKMQRAYAKPGVWAWNANFVGRKFADIMNQDGMRKCVCPNCLAAYDADKPDYATELIWTRTAELAKRLTAEGLDGYVTQMAYFPYGDVPKVDIPDNVLVMVSVGGPWSMGKPSRVDPHVAKVRKWYEKLGRPVWIWTYPMKQFSTCLPDIPQCAPHAVGNYFKRFSPMIFGAFLESESDRFIYNYQNYYVFSRLGWDTAADVDAILDEHDRLMFGAGAAEMRRFFNYLEDTWIKRIVGNEVWSPLGPTIHAASFPEIWTRIYTEEAFGDLDGILQAAEAKVSDDSPESRRIAFMRAQFYDPLVKAGKAFQDAVSVPKALARRAREGNRSIVPGDFETLEPWIVDPETADARITRETFVTGASSIVVTSTNNASVYFPLRGVVKPNTRYRLSYFIKEEVVPLRTGRWNGVVVEFCDTHKWKFFPQNAPVCTCDWMYQEFEWKTGDLKGPEPLRIQLHLGSVSGKVWYDGVRLEEIAGESE